MGILHNMFRRSDKGGGKPQPGQAEPNETQEDIMTELFGGYVEGQPGAAAVEVQTEPEAVSAQDDLSETDARAGESDGYSLDSLGYAEGAIEEIDYVSPEPEEEVYDDYDTTELPADEINAAAEQNAPEEAYAAEMQAGGGVDYSPYAPKDGAADETRDVTFVDLEEVLEPENEQKKKRNGGFFKRRKKAVIGAAVSIGVIGLIVAVVLVFNANIDPLKDYTQMTVGRGNVIQTIATGGAVSPVARYEITSLVAGQVTEVNFEVGDKVKSGDILYQLDDTDAQLAVEKAENDVQKAKNLETKASSASSGLKIYATATGVINDLSIRSGSTVDGGEVAQITREDGTIVSVVPSVSGKVKSVSVRNGQSVTNGQLLATLSSDDLEADQKGQSLDVKSAELSLEAAKKQLDNYSIKSPVDGVVIAKNSKVGDKVSVGDNSNPMMTVADMNSMKFVITVDELDIWDMEIGQMAIVSADAIPKQTFSGEVTNIASEGKVNDAGVTTFDVEITIADPGDLKAGMNVSAKIILQSATNVLTIPAESLIEPDGQNALIMVKNSEMDEDLNPEESAQPTDDGGGEESYSWIRVPVGCSLIPVRYGITDGTNVEITSGLSEGDIIVYQPDADVAEAIANGTASAPSASASPQSSGNPGGALLPNAGSGSGGDSRNGSSGSGNNSSGSNGSSGNSGSNSGSRNSDDSMKLDL